MCFNDEDQWNCNYEDDIDVHYTIVDIVYNVNNDDEGETVTSTRMKMTITTKTANMKRV